MLISEPVRTYEHVTLATFLTLERPGSGVKWNTRRFFGPKI